MKYPLKPEGMSDDAYERTQKLIARLELKYQDKQKGEKTA